MRKTGLASLAVAAALLAFASSARAAVHFNATAADGSRVIFDTDDQLAPTDSDTSVDIYERSGGATTQISRGSINGDGAFNTSFARASTNASRVFFSTEEPLDGQDTNGVSDVYQGFNGATSLVTQGTVPGAVGGSLSNISADGSSAYFAAFAQLVPEDQDNDIDLYERADGTNTNLVTGCEAICGNADGVSPFVSGVSTDRTRVFFVTTEKMVSSDTDAEFDVYERSGGETKLVSQPGAGCAGTCGSANLPAFVVGMSSDGTRVLFDTSESLVGADTDTANDVYQRVGGATTLVTPGTTDDVVVNRLSTDATRLYSETTDALVAADGDSARDVYEFPVSGGLPTLLSQGESACQPGCGNGGFDVSLEMASADGLHIYFETDEQLAGTDTDSEPDIYERSGGVTTHISRGQINGNGEFGPDLDQVASDGSRALFSTEEQLAGTDTDSEPDIYERSGGVTTQVSRGQINGNGGDGASFHAASSDGSRVFFSTDERLAAADVDSASDVYERSGGTTRLVSVEGIPPNTTITAGPTGVTADATPTFRFSSSEPGSSFACSVDGGALTPCTSPRTIGPLGNGPHTFRVRAVDPAANVDPTPVSRSFSVDAPAAADTDPPETTIDRSPKAKTRSRKAGFEFSADEPGSTFECSLDGKDLGSCSSRFTKKVKRKRHMLEVVATDEAGNADPTPAEHGWKVKKRRKR